MPNLIKDAQTYRAVLLAIALYAMVITSGLAAVLIWRHLGSPTITTVFP